jgi:hypothetical protein
LLGNLDCITLDYVARQKVGGTHLTYGYLKQLPVFTPNHYTEADLAFIVPRVLELTYTAHDLKPWAEDLGHNGPPFEWNPNRRALLRAELDAYYARLYSLTRDELRYILDPADVMGDDYPSETFRVLKNSEIRAFGEYRTQRLVLEAWDRLAAAESLGMQYFSPLVPAPGELSADSLSSQGVIGNEVQARFAGLLFSIVVKTRGLTFAAIQSAVATASIPQYRERLLDAPHRQRMDEALSRFPGILSPDTIDGMGSILGRLESAGCLSVARTGSSLAYSATAIPLPSDVIRESGIDELAEHILALESGRISTLDTVRRGSAGKDESRKLA